MTTHRSRTAHDLRVLAGQIPSPFAAAAIAGAVFFTTAAFAQEGDVRNPMASGSGQAQVTVGEHDQVDLHVKDEDLVNVLELLSMQTERSIVVSKNVSARVTASLYDVTFNDALDAILHVNGFGYIEQGNFIYVYTREELAEIIKDSKQRIAKAIHLNYLNAEDAKTFAEPLLSAEGGSIQVNETVEDFQIDDNTPVGGEDYALSATMVVYDYEENIAAIEALINELDTQPSQVLVEATILQTSLTENNAFGVDFSVITDLDFADFIGPLGVVDDLIRAGTPDSNATAVQSTPGDTSGPGTLKIGVMLDEASVFIKMLDDVSDTTILSNPKILCLNRQPSRVLVGRRVGYLSSTTTDTATTQTIEFLDTGTQLYFRPFVSKNGNIRMELKPQVSEAIIRDAVDSSGGTVAIPDEITQEIVTNVIVGDGQTIVLGGLFREATTSTRRQVPLLGDLPLVGAAFRGHDDEVGRSEIIFMVTPSIVTDTLMAAAAEKAMSDVERVRAGARQGLLPFSRTKMTAADNLKAEMLAREGKYDEAMWHISKSLSLNPNQPEVYRLREQLTGKMERWPNPSVLDHVLGSEMDRMLEGIEQPTERPRNWKPYNGYGNIRKYPIEGHRLNEPKQAEPVSQATEPAIFEPVENPFDTTFDQDQASLPAEVAPVVTPVATATAPKTAPVASFGEAEKAAVAQVQALSRTLRSQIDIYTFEHYDQAPALNRENGWAPLVQAELISAPPVNGWVGGENATLVVAGEKPDTRFHQDYGWIFNPKTGQLWAAGFDANDQPLARPADFAARPVLKTFSIKAAGEPVQTVLANLARQSGRKIVLGEGVVGQVTVALNNVSFYEALNGVLKPNQLTYVEEADAVYIYTNAQVEAMVDAEAPASRPTEAKSFDEMSFEEWLAAVKQGDAKSDEVVGVDTESSPR